MGEVISMGDYLERKAGEVPREDLTRRLAEISLEILILGSEKKQIERQLLGPPDTIA